MLPDFDDDPEDPFPPIPGRTMLFRLAPIGMGTPYCEGLTSYLVRLAQEHSLPVRRFVSRLLLTDFKDVSPRFDAKFFRQYAATINGVGSYAQRFARALNQATGRTDLELLTLRPWRLLLPSHGAQLTFPSRQWCPECLDGDLSDTQHVPYWPLAWSMASVRRCSRHGVDLADRCPHCSRRQPAIPRLADFVHCHACRGLLAESSCKAAATPSSRETTSVGLSTAEQLIELNGSIDATSVHRQWVDAVAVRLAQMNWDRAALCRQVGLNPRAMNAWMNKGCAVSMDSLVKIHAGLAMSASEIFGPKVQHRRSLHRAAVVAPKQVACSRVFHPIEVRLRAASLLDEALAAKQPPKLCDIAAALRTSTGFIRYWYPEKVARLRSRNLEVERAERKARHERHLREVEAAVERLRASGVFPGRKVVEGEVRDRGASLIEPRNYRAYRAALKSASTEGD